jgi:hypothetical protein
MRFVQEQTEYHYGQWISPTSVLEDTIWKILQKCPVKGKRKLKRNYTSSSEKNTHIYI